MVIRKIILAVASFPAIGSLAGAAAHYEAMKQVATYKPLAGFSHVVGEERFVGYFVPGPDRCDVTVFQASADDEALSTPARRTLLQIAAGGRSEIAAGPDSALAIACTADADAIKVAPQTGRLHAAGL